VSASERTRRSLHGVAELLMAGPQYRASGTIRLRTRSGGFGTVAPPDVRVDGGDLVVDGKRFALNGTSVAALAARTGLDAGPPEGLYHDHAEVGSDEPLEVDPVAASKLAEAFAVGDAALRALAPEQTPVIWPEHFDIAIRVGNVNFGVSPGDAYHAAAYAYVGVDPVPAGEFWNAPFGASRPLAGSDQVTAFFAEGRARARGSDDTG
jgi:hypothetical protein